MSSMCLDCGHQVIFCTCKKPEPRRLTDEELEALLACPYIGRQWRHIKSGRIYLTTGFRMSKNDMRVMVDYQNAKGIKWSWPRDQFEAGFELVDKSF